MSPKPGTSTSTAANPAYPIKRPGRAAMAPAVDSNWTSRRNFNEVPTAVLPSSDRKRKQKSTFCQRLARNLERYDENPGVFDITRRKPLPPLLALPAELRQCILVYCLDDEEILYPRPNSITQPLAMVCSTFAGDVQQVRKLWDTRERAVRKSYGAQQNFSLLVADLLRPIQAASAALSAQTNLRPRKADRRKRDYNGTRISSSTSSRDDNGQTLGVVAAGTRARMEHQERKARQSGNVARREKAQRIKKRAEERLQKREEKRELQRHSRMMDETLYHEWAEKHPQRVAIAEMRKAYMAGRGVLISSEDYSVLGENAGR